MNNAAKTEATETYDVINVEQDGRSVWSSHKTEALAVAAARRYARKNRPVSFSLPFEVRRPDGSCFRVEVA
jgi:hypothetical protein